MHAQEGSCDIVCVSVYYYATAVIHMYVHVAAALYCVEIDNLQPGKLKISLS